MEVLGGNEQAYIILTTRPMATQLPKLYGGRKPVYVLDAYKVISSYTKRAMKLLTREEPDALRLDISAQKIRLKCIPLFKDLRRMPEVPRAWVKKIGETLTLVETKLIEAAKALEGNDEPEK